MKPDRPDTTKILIDIKYKSSLNEFEEFYGENVTYREIEQKSYILFKDIMFDKINSDIKFRKYGRIGLTLTIKAFMFKEEIEIFKRMLEKDEIDLLYGWIITNITIIKDNKIQTQ